MKYILYTLFFVSTLVLFLQALGVIYLIQNQNNLARTRNDAYQAATTRALNEYFKNK